ncbi:MAG: hypothetical protein OXC93_05035 [Rhodospirillaceae bacterium]|nr:hypothetical protein [Rhodospirillaceae bacterium]
MDEDRAEDAIRGGPVLEGSHGPGSSADFPEPSFEGVHGSMDVDHLLLAVVADAQRR